MPPQKYSISIPIFSWEGFLFVSFSPSLLSLSLPPLPKSRNKRYNQCPIKYIVKLDGELKPLSSLQHPLHTQFASNKYIRRRRGAEGNQGGTELHYNWVWIECNWSLFGFVRILIRTLAGRREPPEAAPPDGWRCSGGSFTASLPTGFSRSPTVSMVILFSIFHCNLFKVIFIVNFVQFNDLWFLW